MCVPVVLIRSSHENWLTLLLLLASRRAWLVAGTRAVWQRAWTRVGRVADNTRRILALNVSCLCKFMIPGLTTYYVTTYYLLGLGLGLGLFRTV